MEQAREKIRFEHIRLLMEDDTEYALMGLEQGKEYTDEELVSLCKMPVKVYPEGMLYDLFKLTGEERKQASKKMVSLLNVMYGYNWMVVHDFILARYEERLWDISYFLYSSFDTILNKELNKNWSAFRDIYGSYSKYGHWEKIYKRLSRAEKMNNPSPETKMLIYKICAMYFISPKLIQTGQGKMFSFYPSVTRREDFPEKLEKYRKKIVRDFANDLTEELDALDPTGGKLMVSDHMAKDKIAGENGIQLTKENVAEWMGISPDEIGEVEGVIPFVRQNGNKSRLNNINNTMKK